MTAQGAPDQAVLEDVRALQQRLAPAGSEAAQLLVEDVVAILPTTVPPCAPTERAAPKDHSGG